MSTLEERLARDIAAVTGGVVVTEADLRDARTAVDERIQGRRRRDRAVVAVAAAAAVALTAVGVTAFVTTRGDDEPVRLAEGGADAPDPDADYLTGGRPTAQLVDGLWRLDNGDVVVKFDDDGTVRFDDFATVFSDPATTATYTIDGDRITVTTTADDRPGCVGTELVLRASVSGPGLLRFVAPGIAGACAPLPAGRGALEQVLPTSPTWREFVFSKDTGWQPVADKTVLHGVWAAEGGGHVLAIEPGGAYYVADSSGDPVDTGRWSLGGADLTLTSSAASSRCREGDRLLLASVEWIDADTAAFRGTVRQNACGGTWTPAAWILIPNAGR